MTSDILFHKYVFNFLREEKSVSADTIETVSFFLCNIILVTSYFDIRHFSAIVHLQTNVLETMKIYENLKIPFLCFLFHTGNLDDFVIH